MSDRFDIGDPPVGRIYRHDYCGHVPEWVPRPDGWWLECACGTCWHRDVVVRNV